MKILVHKLSLLPASARQPAKIKAICRKAVGSRRGELNVVFLGRAEMLKLNKRYLRHGHDTDVIAFRYPKEPGGEAPFGDVFISAFQARKQAKALGHPVLFEVLTLAAHGTLHLLGYDDATPRQKARMFRIQDRLLRG